MEVLIAAVASFLSFSFFTVLGILLFFTFLLILKQYMDITSTQKKAKETLLANTLSVIQIKIHAANEKKEEAMVSFLQNSPENLVEVNNLTLPQVLYPDNLHRFVTR